MKILNILLDGRVGGPQMRVVSIARKLKNLGIESIIAMPTKGDFKNLMQPGCARGVFY